MDVALGVALCGFAAAADGVDFAEVELVGSAVSRSDSAPPVFGYDAPASPDLVSSSDTATPLGAHAGHEDSVFARERLYRSAERVNADRNRGSLGTARGDIVSGHSIAVMSGWADAGSNAVGGAAEAHAGLFGSSNGGASSAMRIEKRTTILPGSSGLEAGTLVTGLRWEFDGHGALEVGGMTHPSTGGSSAGCDLGLLVLRGPTGTCGAFDCPQGALAVAVQLETGFEFQAADPAATGGLTGIFDRNRSWSASYNAGAFKAGGVFESGGDHVDVGLPITDEDVWVTRVEAVDSGGEPLGLASIEFEANVGETLRVELHLDVAGAVSGAGYGRAEFFESFGGRAVDPLARGLIFESSVPVPEAPRPALLLTTMFALAAGACRSATRRRGVTGGACGIRVRCPRGCAY